MLTTGALSWKAIASESKKILNTLTGIEDCVPLTSSSLLYRRSFER